MSAIGRSGDVVTGNMTGSAACAQQPQVTQVGGHAPWLPEDSSDAQGSAVAKLVRPAVLIVSNATTTARTKRRTDGIVAPGAGAIDSRSGDL